MAQERPNKRLRQDATDSSSTASSMIVLNVDFADHRTRDPESQPLIARKLQTLGAPSVAFKGMQSPPRNGIQFHNIFRFLDRSQHRAKLRLILPHNAARITPSPESFEFFVPKTDDPHIKPYGVTVQKSIATYIPSGPRLMATTLMPSNVASRPRTSASTWSGTRPMARKPRAVRSRVRT